jgi:pantetheine-phosphate adenylyltransferase
MKKEFVAVYPGFFDPLTLGHVNIVERAVRVFDRVIVAVAADSVKHSMFTPEERLEIIRETFPNNPKVVGDKFSGLLINYIKKSGAAVLLRGIRTVSDFEYEYQMALANKVLAEDVETFFMMTEGEYSYLSSTVIKEIARLGGDITHMVPQSVGARVRKKYAT